MGLAPQWGKGCTKDMREDRGIKKEKKTRSEVGGTQAEVWMFCSFPRVDSERKYDFQGVRTDAGLLYF